MEFSVELSPGFFFILFLPLTLASFCVCLNARVSRRWVLARHVGAGWLEPGRDAKLWSCVSHGNPGSQEGGEDRR